MSSEHAKKFNAHLQITEQTRAQDPENQAPSDEIPRVVALRREISLFAETVRALYGSTDLARQLPVLVLSKGDDFLARISLKLSKSNDFDISGSVQGFIKTLHYEISAAPLEKEEIDLALEILQVLQSRLLQR